MMSELNERTRQILKLVIDAYVETGEPVGSRIVSQKPGMKLSPATIRHAMVELEELGLLYSPHISAGRLPTDTGLTMFVDGMLEINDLSADDRRKIEQEIHEVKGKPISDILEQTSSFLSGLSSCAGLVFAPKIEAPIRQIEFILLAPGRALAVLVTSTSIVENRVMEVPSEVTATALQRASNYLNSRIADKTLQEAIEHIRTDLQDHKAQLDALTEKVVKSGIASLASKESGGHFFIRGQANLLDDITALEDLERIQSLFDALEAKETMLKLLQATSLADGMKIFIGSENKLFDHSGCTLIVSPYKNQEASIVGVIGVIGPTRLNYGRIIPVVNYTSQMIGKIME
ncbi:MAG: heat-inducible transcriptional repressor HrcA [Alphaproteobacteria bacterium]|nr:heat-inducible transcriptional repressor HrcA [Alphaproteobacteria bacterium]MCK5658443.1 heat-inducible transcriptional repressor HrcA [Alphaproteobacteria bacterium]